jgi:hypothetical protein
MIIQWFVKWKWVLVTASSCTNKFQEQSVDGLDLFLLHPMTGTRQYLANSQLGAYTLHALKGPG